MSLIFVYGTLKRGYWNNRLLGDSKFLGEVVTDDAYRMYDVGYPLLVERRYGDFTEAGHVMGEVFEVDEDTRSNLDRLEGHPHNYRRTTIWVNNLDTGAKMAAEAYVWQRDTHHATVVHPESGIIEWRGAVRCSS